MLNLYAVSIRWVKSPIDISRIDAVLSNYGDWLRFSSFSWLIASTSSAIIINEAIMAVLLPEDNILVLKCDLSDYSGFAQPWVWEWVAKFRPNALGGLAAYLPEANVNALGMPPRNPLIGPRSK
jgi:hypothetical protein